MLEYIDRLRAAEERKRSVQVGSEDGIQPDVRLINVEPRPLDRVLALWREAQLRLETARPGSAAAEAAVRDIERLRDEYQAGHDVQMEAGGARLADPRDTS